MRTTSNPEVEDVEEGDQKNREENYLEGIPSASEKNVVEAGEGEEEVEVQIITPPPTVRVQILTLQIL